MVLVARFFLYVFLAAIVVLLAVGAQQMLGSFGVSNRRFNTLFAKYRYVAHSNFCVLSVEMELWARVLHQSCLFSG